MTASLETRKISRQTEKQREANSSNALVSIWLAFWPFLLVVCVATAVFFGNLGDHPLFNPDEGLYAEPAREMLETGQYITTLLNYVVRFTKPPLVIWAMAGCYQLFGVNEFAARFFGAACGLILVAATYWFAAKYVNWRAALFACLTLCTCPLFLATGREAITDMPLALFVGGSLMAFFHAYQQKSTPWRLAAYVLIGLAVMTKGPVGLLLPVLILGVFHLGRRDLMRVFWSYKPIIGLAIVALIAVPWFALEIYITKGAYFYEFLVRENFQRFTGVVDHKYPVWYHLVAVLGGYMPWSVFIPQALVSALAVSSSNHPYKTMMSKPFAWLDGVEQARGVKVALLFCACWFLVTLGFFSASVSKLLPYTVPAFPALAILIGSEIDSSLRLKRLKRLAVPVLLLAIVFGAGQVIAPFAVNKLRDAPPDLVALVSTALWSLFAVCATALVAFLCRRPGWGIGIFTSGVVVCTALVGSKALDVLSAEWEEPIANFGRYAAISNQPIIVFDIRKPGLPFYTLRPVLQPGPKEMLVAELAKCKEAYILSRDRNNDFFKSLGTCKIIAKQGKFVLLSHRAKDNSEKSY